MKDTSALDDQELVQMALSDRNAYGLLIARYEGPILRYVQRVLGGHGYAAEDVCQEAFINAYLNLRGYDASRPFAPWIYRIAHNQAVSLLRKRQAEPQHISGEDGQLLLERIADSNDASLEHAAKATHNALREAMAGLDQRYRDVLVLRYLEEKSYSEISDILQLPLGTVATLIKRGLERLRLVLDRADSILGYGAS